MNANWKSRPKRVARSFVDRVVAPYLDSIRQRPIETSVTEAGPAPAISFVMSDTFHAAVHELRTLELATIPKGVNRALSVGAQGSWYFEWFRQQVGELEQHIGIEAFEPMPDDLPDYVTWIADTADQMEHVGDASVDLVYAGQTSEHLWAHELVGFLSEAHRVLSAGGRLVLDSPNRLVTEHLYWSHGGHTIELSRAEISHVLDLAGFEVETVTGVWSCVENGVRLGLEEGLERPEMLTRRAMRGHSRPDESFIWWVTAKRRTDKPNQAALTDEVARLFGEHWPTRVSRGFFPGPHQDLELSRGPFGRLAATLPLPIHAGAWEISINLRSGDWMSLPGAVLTIEAPGEHILHRLLIEDAAVHEQRATWSVQQPFLVFAVSLVLTSAVTDDVTIAFPIEMNAIGPFNVAAPSEAALGLPSRTIREFVESYEAGLVTLENAASVSYAYERPDPTTEGSPLGDDYHEWVMSTWRAITGRSSYEPDLDESFSVDPTTFLARPYPYNTGQAIEISNYLGCVAWAVGQLNLSEGTKVVEFGAGWGHLSLALAMSGCQVTTVDLNRESVELLRLRSHAWNVPLKVEHSSFLQFEPVQNDVTIFFEAFHHCHRPFELIERAISQLTPGGRLVFIAEAVYEGFELPWGVRLDGTAAYMARRFGWLELGFERSFFLGHLRSRGLSVTETRKDGLGSYGYMITAEKAF